MQSHDSHDAAVSGSNPATSEHNQILLLATSLWISRAVYAAARLGLPDLLADGPRSVEELATSTRMHAPSLYRLMRLLASIGLFSQQPGRRFLLRPLGATLRSDAPGGAHATVLALAGRRMWETWGDFMYSLQTGKTAFEKIYERPLFEHMSAHPEEAKYFAQAMVGLHGDEPPAVAAAYDFSEIATLVDVGGNTGNMLAAIASRYPQLQGIVYDLPHVVKGALASFEALGLSSRCGAIGGSFFDSIPAGRDAYLLSHIIHDWDESQCLAILGQCRRAMGAKGRLLIVEMVLPSGDEPHAGKMLDLLMLTVAGGLERTAEEYTELLAKADLRVTRVLPTASAVSIVEAVAA